MKKLRDASVDMILCDLPYGTTCCKWDSIIPLDKLWEQYERLIKTNGAIVLTASQPFTTKLISSNYGMFRYEWIWQKNNSTGFQNANIMPLKKHENVCVFYKKKPMYNPQGLQEYGKINRRGRPGETIHENGVKSNEYIQKYTNFPTSILEFSYDKQKLHPTQKPVALFEYLIRTYTNYGDLVLDNCIGSGTTAVAALNTGRNFIGFELSPEYCEIAEKRMSKAIKMEDKEELQDIIELSSNCSESEEFDELWKNKGGDVS